MELADEEAGERKGGRPEVTTHQKDLGFQAIGEQPI
jgi:hypothetical protein